jgi:Aldehyde dehydrogenase family
MRRNSQHILRIATPLCAPGDALRAMERTHPLGEARLNDEIPMAHELTFDHQRSTAVSRFKDEAEAIALANTTDYGLGGGLWTTNLARAHRVADALKTGMAWVNCYKRVHPGSPFGGTGQSGYGRHLGTECLAEYTEPKSF